MIFGGFAEMAAAMAQAGMTAVADHTNSRPQMPNYQPLGAPGGQEYDEMAYTKATLRADLCEITTKYSFNHGAKIVDEIMKKYDIKRKKAPGPKALTSKPSQQV